MSSGSLESAEVGAMRSGEKLRGEGGTPYVSVRKRSISSSVIGLGLPSHSASPPMCHQTNAFLISSWWAI